jgi:hypothetical protein
MGIFVLLIIVLAFAVGALRQALALVLAGAAFFLPWAYCLCMTLFLTLIHYRRARRAFIRVSPREVTVGGSAEAVYSEGDTVSVGAIRILQVPGIVVRCRLLLDTRDGRRIRYDFNPADASTAQFFAVEKRGAYFTSHDEFAIFDTLGFFRFAWRLPAETDARLLASPCAAEEQPSIKARAGESNLSPEFSFQRTDNFIDHRPYVPGDDPRRINWKLYGHGGGLFVREGEREPPPHSNIVILIDTEFDPRLYSASAARRGVDILCENALSAANACAESGMDLRIGYTGGPIREGNAAALAWPAALPLASSAGLPPVPDDRGILILALTRSCGKENVASNSALDRFLQNNAGRPVDLLFFCGDFIDDNVGDNHHTIVYRAALLAAERFPIAEFCAASYNQRPGVRAGIMGY